MYLNNKGITLVEIIISVALISIVLVFLFTLLIQVNNENSDNEARSSYLVNQSTFIKQIEEDFLDYKLLSGNKCNMSNINVVDVLETNDNNLYIPRLEGDPLENENIKCLKFSFDSSSKYKYAYLFLYQRSNVALSEGESSFKTILSYYRGDFKQSVELEDFVWSDNLDSVIVKEGSVFKIYSLPIVGPDMGDYSINLSYAS